MSTLSKKFSKDLVITKKRLEETEALVNKELEGMYYYMYFMIIQIWTITTVKALLSSHHSLSGQLSKSKNNVSKIL